MIHAVSSSHVSTIEGSTSVKVKLPDAAVDLKKIEQVQVPKPSPAKFDLEKLAHMSMRDAGCLKRKIFQTVNSISVANEEGDAKSIVKLCKKEFEKLGLDIRSKDIKYIIDVLKNNHASDNSQVLLNSEVMIREKINTIIAKFFNNRKSGESSLDFSAVGSGKKDIITGGMETEIKALSMAWEFPVIPTNNFDDVLQKLNTVKDRKDDPQLSNISNKIYVNNKSKDDKENIEILVVGANRLYNKIKISGDKVKLYDYNNRHIKDHKFNKEVVANIRAFLENPESIDKSKLSRSIMESVELPIIDVRVEYAEVLGDIYFKPRDTEHRKYTDSKMHIADVTVDHKTVESQNEVWGRASIPEVVTRGAKTLPDFMSENEGKIRDQSMTAIAEVFARIDERKVESVSEIGTRFNIRNNWRIIDINLPTTLKDINCIKKGESVLFKTDKALKEKQTIFQLQHLLGDNLIINISLNLKPSKGRLCKFETSVNIVKCENIDMSIFARDIKRKEKELNQLVSKTIAEQLITDGADKILPINIGALVKEFDENWTSDHPLMIWDGNIDHSHLLMQKLDKKYIEGKTPMYTQMTIGARNKDFHYSVIIPKLKNELKLQKKKFKDAELSSPVIRGESMLQRYKADGIYSDRLCEEIISSKDFQSGFNKFRTQSWRPSKDFDSASVKCNDLKGAMNMLFHQFVSAQTETMNGKEYGYKNSSVFLMKSTLREMMKENMRSEESKGLEKLFKQKHDKFVQRFVSYLNARLEEMRNNSDKVFSFPLTAETSWNPRFYNDADFGSSPSIEEILDYIFSEDEYRYAANYRRHLDPTAVSTIGSEFSGKNDHLASGSMERVGEDGHTKAYKKLGRRTIVELRWPTINSKSMPFWFSDRFMKRDHS